MKKIYSSRIEKVVRVLMKNRNITPEDTPTMLRNLFRSCEDKKFLKAIDSYEKKLKRGRKIRDEYDNRVRLTGKDYL